MNSVEVRALRIFDRYAEMDVRARTAGLEALKVEDPELHDALSALLAADSCERPLDRAPVAAVAAIMQARSNTDEDERIGARVGPWRIVGIIGQGGMGIVYRVERADGQYEQTAALKFVRTEVSSEKLMEAFCEERNVLASLTHPDIVPLLDGGVDENEQPWFVMQHVEGETIEAWCNKRKTSIRDRVALFVQACDPIVYAHARGILHRDIKPSNVLVTGDGRIQLLDFGLSTPVLSERGSKRLAITSGYTAPEVLKGDATGFAVDVYSLGILLCQLLCGNFPVKLSSSRHLTNPPSTLVDRMTPSMLAARGAMNHRAIKNVLKGELDSIVLRCVQEDPGERYASVDQLRSDLQNWLSARPVSAHGDGIAYRTRCFIRRHAYLTMTLTVAILALTALGGVWLWQRVQAEKEQVTASHVDRLLESSIGMATLSGMGDMPLTPAAMLQRSEDYLRSAPLEEQADVRSRGFSILGRNWAALGDYERAEKLVREAQETSSGNALLSAFNLATLAQIQNLRADHAEAEVSANAGLALMPFRLSDQYQLARVRLLSQLAAAQSGQGRSRAAFQTLSSAIETSQKLPKEIGEPVVAQLLIQRGTWYRWRHLMVESDADLQRAIGLARETDPVIADDARESLVRTVRASRAVGREKRSLQLAEELLESRRRTLGERNPQTGVAWTELAFIRLLNADPVGAQEAVDNARDILAESVGQSHSGFARMMIAQSFVDTSAGRIDDAIGRVEQAVEIYRRNNGDSYEFTLEARFLLASLYWSLFARSGDEKYRKSAIDIVEATIADAVRAHGQVSAIHRMAYANLLAGTNDGGQKARNQIDLARRDAISQFGADSQEALHVRLTEVSMMITGDNPESEIQGALDSLLADVGKVDTLYARSIAHTAWLERGRWMTKQNRFGEARESYLQARQEAELAHQGGWIQVSDIKLKELEGLIAESR